MPTKPVPSSELSNSDSPVSGIYVGGPIYKNGATTVATLAASGFTEVIVWNIAVDTDGDLNFNYEFPLVEGGLYVGAQTHPDFQTNIASLKGGASSVTRLTFSIGSSNIGVFEAIKTLVEGQGTGPDSILHQNFVALKAAIPAIDAIDFDDENCYDAASMTRFAVMLGTLGFAVNLCPYTYNDFWTGVAASANGQRSGTITAVHLQCYSGGAGNSPCEGWDFGPLPVYPGLAASDSTPGDVAETLAGWNRNCGITGAFIWAYDDIERNDPDLLKAYAGAIDSTLAAKAPSMPA